MVVPGIIPIRINRYYVSRLGGSAVSSTGSDGLGAFGKGMSFEYDWRADKYADMIRISMPSGSFFDFHAVRDLNQYIIGYGNDINPEFSGARVDYNEVSMKKTLTTRDGWKYIFEAAGGLVNVVDRNGNTVTITRHYNGLDSVGYIKKITNSEGKEILFQQTPDGQYFVKTDMIIGPDGRTVRYSYENDPFSVYPRIKSVTGIDGTVVQYGYDNQGRMNAITDANGIVKIANIYDANNRVISQTTPDGAIYSYSYTAPGGTVTQTDMTAPNGSVTTWRFTSSGYISDITTPDGETAYEIDSYRGTINGVTDALNRTTSYTYNRDRLFQIYDPIDLHPIDGTQNNGLVERITDPMNNKYYVQYYQHYGLPSVINKVVVDFEIPWYEPVAYFDYLFTNNKIMETMASDAMNNQTFISYNDFGVPISMTDPNGNTSTVAYDTIKHSQVTSASDALGNAVSYTYDSNGRVSAVIDAKGAKTTFAYDNADQMVSSSDALGNTTSYAYDNNGNLLFLVDAKGNTTKYQYDVMNRLIKTTDRLGRSEYYTYYTGSEITSTTGNNLKSYTNKRGQVTTFNTYDAMNRLTMVTFADGSTIQYAYDAGGRVTTIADSISGTINYSYDLLDRVTQEITPSSTINYTYDTFGQRTSMTLNGESAVSYRYDDAHRPTLINKYIGGYIRGFEFQYDNGGRRTLSKIPLSSIGAQIVTSYGFDAADRLTAMTHQSPMGTLESIGYTSDANSNRTSMTRAATLPQINVISGASYNAEYEMLSYNGNTLTYDEDGNLATKTDSNGNVTTYTWDARNRLVGISAPTATPTLSASFQYDALNRRISKTVNGITTTYVYDGIDIIQETTNGVKTEYIRTLGVDEPLSKVTDGGVVQHYLRDGLGSVIGLVDDAGNQVSTISYDAYGNTTSTESLGFTGRENDGTGLMYYRARYYSPEMGRFIARDPLRFAAETANFYVYGNNNPVNLIDPNGLKWIYQQSSGNLYYQPSNSKIPILVSNGYAGNGQGLNNPDYQNVKNVGPIPQGSYRIGTQQDNITQTGHILESSMRLYPFKSNNMFSRAGFLIHRGNMQKKSSSQGCIVLTDDARDTIGNNLDVDNILEVIK